MKIPQLYLRIALIFPAQLIHLRFFYVSVGICQDMREIQHRIFRSKAFRSWFSAQSAQTLTPVQRNSGSAALISSYSAVRPLTSPGFHVNPSPVPPPPKPPTPQPRISLHAGGQETHTVSSKKKRKDYQLQASRLFKSKQFWVQTIWKLALNTEKVWK